MKKNAYYLLVLIVILIGCSGEHNNAPSFGQILSGSPKIEGTKSYLSSPYVTAGNRVYMVGHQDGSFPEIGWHIKGEMGGIWNHPIKLMDGFEAEINWEGHSVTLDKAENFVNYSMANAHEYNFPEKNLKVYRLQFVPDDKEGIIVQYSLENTGGNTQSFDLVFTGHSDLRPTWLGERTQMVDTTDKAEYIESQEAWLMKDQNNDWFALFGADQTPTRYSETENTRLGLGTSALLQYSLTIPANSTETIDFTIAGSYTSRDAALLNFKDLKTHSKLFLKQKEERYAQLAEQSKLTIPDKDLQQAFEWLKYNCDWLIQTVPEVGTGITAGIPDYPWWFGVDSEYALKGYMAIGQKEVVYSTIKLLDSVSNAVNGNGKIIHEMSTNGAVFNDGNINETPQFASLIWEIYQWNGDRAFLEKYFPTIKKGLQWLMQENDADKNLFPDGFGMMEIHGLDSEMIDVATYTQRAFSDASKIASELGDETLAAAYKANALNLRKKINQEFWSEEFESYADFIGTDEQALHLIEDAIIRADTLNKPWAVAELKETQKKILANPSKRPRPFVLHHNWVVNTPMEMAITDSARAIRALETAEKFVNPFGVFVTGIDRDASAGSDEGSFKGSKIFSYTGAVMTLPTGVQAIAENNYGRPDEALNYLKRMTRTFSYALPGSMYEVSPDYGMMTQAWNIYSYAIPIVNQFFGIRPDAANRRVVIKPQMPSEWNEAALENVAIADNEISVFYKKTDGTLDLRVTQTNSDWEIEVVLPKDDSITYSIDSEVAKSSETKHKTLFTTKGKSLQIQSKSN